MVKTTGLRAAAACAVLFALSFAPTAGAGQKQAESKGAREIRSVLDKQVESWNERDLEGFMAGYRRSPELSFFSGAAKTGGWDATLERYRKRYQSEGAEMGKLDFSELQIELLGPDHAFVRGRWRLKMSSGEQGGLFTLIFRKMGGGWKIVHDHTC
jgi:beta-aspartyl-peptidase (threonine type)